MAITWKTTDEIEAEKQLAEQQRIIQEAQRQLDATDYAVAKCYDIRVERYLRILHGYSLTAAYCHC